MDGSGIFISNIRAVASVQGGFMAAGRFWIFGNGSEWQMGRLTLMIGRASRYGRKCSPESERIPSRPFPVFMGRIKTLFIRISRRGRVPPSRTAY